MQQTSNNQDFIKEIYDENFLFKNPRQSITQSKLLDSISCDIYADAMRFLIEILQNVDDSSFEFDKGDLNMKICISKQSLLISHKGKAFDQSDILSLCSAGKSTKGENHKATGYKGIGFKSVFAVSDKVLIMSNGYNFKFDKDYFTKEKCWQNEWGNSSNPFYNEIKKPWQIIPINFIPKNEIKDELLLNLTKDYTVNFLFFIKSKSILDEIRGNLTNIFLQNPMNIVFLKSKNITIRFQQDNEEKIILKKEDVGNSIFNISSNEKIINTFFNHQFILNTSDFINKKTRDLIMHEETFPKKLKDAKNIEISFSVPVKKVDNNYEVGTLENDHRVIYSYLPTLENFNFPIFIEF